MKITTLLLALFLTTCLFAQNTIQESLSKHVYYLASDSLLGRGFGDKGGDMAAKYIATQFEQARLTPIGKDFFHHFNHRSGIATVNGKNVVGVLPGNDPVLKNEYIVMGAHYDHLGCRIEDGDTTIYNGADDNATGTSTVIELAKYFASKHSNRRTLVFIAFDGEESGLIGSEWFVHDSILKPNTIKAMFSIDMVGMYNTYNGVEFGGTGLIENGEQWLTEIANQQNTAVKEMGKKISNRTDTKHFGDAGVPAIHVNTGTKSPYHKPEDDAPLLEYDGMVKVFNLLSTFVEKIDAENTIAPTFLPKSDKLAENDEKSKPVQLMWRMNFGGNNHDYKNEFFNGKRLSSLETGLSLRIKVSKFLDLEPEVLYQLNRAQSALGKYITHGLCTPVNFIIHPRTRSLEYPYVKIGGYYANAFDGKVKDKANLWTSNFNSTDYGITWGLGIQTRRGQIGFYQRIGLADLNKNKTSEISNFGAFFSIGYNL